MDKHRYASGGDFRNHSSINISDKQVRKNVIENLKLGLQEVRPHDNQDRTIMVVGGGNSINEFQLEIYVDRINGMGLVTMNGSYNWCLEKKINPSIQIVLDGREFNKRFVTPIVPTCKYLIASQCHPDLVRSIPKDQVYLWHSGSSDTVSECIKEHDTSNGIETLHYPIYGGMTVMNRAFYLLSILGFRKLRVYGFDSCLIDGKHHGYEQKENDLSDDRNIVDITCHGRIFQCYPWMVTQAHEFIEIIQKMGDISEMEVMGDGLIAHIIKSASEEGEKQNGGSILQTIQHGKEVS